MLAEPEILQTAGTRRFFDYWNSLPKSGGVPDRSDFNPVAVASLMPAVSILEIVSDTMILQRLAGTALCRAMGFDPTGRNSLEYIREDARPAYLELLHMQTRFPCGRRNVIRSRHDNMIDCTEVLTLPISHRVSGRWMILSYFESLQRISYEPGPDQILGYEETRWIDIGAGVPD